MSWCWVAEVFNKYIEEINQKYKDKVIGVSFRSKQNGWRNYTTRLSFATRFPIYKVAIKDSYMSCYLQKAIYRKSCYQCKYATLPRLGDITIGDFAGIDRNVINKADYCKGVSVILLNNKKSKKYFEGFKTYLHWLERPLHEATTTNFNIYRPSIMPDSRKIIFKDNGSTEEIKNKYCKYKLRVHIANLVGDDITRYLRIVIRKLGL